MARCFDIGKRKSFLAIITFLMLSFALLIGFNTFCFCGNFSNSSNYEPRRIVSPYDGIDFQSILRLRANLHTHTTASDGRETADEMIRLYAEKGYDIVAITDHRTFGVDSTEYRIVEGRQVLVIKGIEAGRYHHHFNSLFASYNTRFRLSTKLRIEAHIRNCDGIMFLNHPARYRRFSDRWYECVFSRFPAERLVGMEVVNLDDRYPESRDLWDRLLTKSAPGRVIWGFANDDSHNADEVGFSFNEFFVEENNINNIRYAIQNGRSFFYSKISNAAMPFVRNIIVNQEQLTIAVYAENADLIHWISRGSVVSEESEISIIDLGLERYVRFTITNSGGILYSQPFLLSYY